MYSLSECFGSESNSEPLKWNIRRIFFQKLFRDAPRQLFLHKAPSQMFHLAKIPFCRKPSLSFSKAKQLTYLLIKLLLGSSQNRSF